MFTFKDFPEDMEVGLPTINDFSKQKNIIEFEKSLNSPQDYIKKKLGWLLQSSHIN